LGTTRNAWLARGAPFGKSSSTSYNLGVAGTFGLQGAADKAAIQRVKNPS
jgi:hypothetical protein